MHKRIFKKTPNFDVINLMSPVPIGVIFAKPLTI